MQRKVSIAAVAVNNGKLNFLTSGAIRPAGLG
jgi:hypothetical protein